MAEKPSLYRFHHSNIHERRTAASLVRAIPLIWITAFATLVFIGVFRAPILLLILSAATNVSMWLWMSSMALVAIIGSWSALRSLDEAIWLRAAKPAGGLVGKTIEVAVEVPEGIAAPGPDACAGEPSRTGAAADLESQQLEDSAQNNVTHIIVLPNYKEDEEMMAETLESLSECNGSDTFRVVLGMEAREGAPAKEKAQRLKTRFAGKFAHISFSTHPADLVERHNDGSEDLEVAGKASNLKWAVAQVNKDITTEGIVAEECVLTVADADCLFHPDYFSHISRDFNMLRQTTQSEHLWSMWQAPQLPFRNYYEAPVPSRAWGYVASFYEFGGVSSLLLGGHHMVFSGYTLPLTLAVGAEAWDGDVMAEDHHAYLKCVFYSVWAGGKEGTARNPIVKVRPVLLPVKSTSVVSDHGYWQTWVERWHQAKRHAQGVAELSYAVLASYDTIQHLPLSAYSWDLVWHLSRLLLRLFYVHLLPSAQFLAMTVMSIYWLYNNRQVPYCPDRIWVAPMVPKELLCGFAGAWALTWPMLIPMSLVITANVLFLWVSFVRPANKQGLKAIWHREDGHIQPTCGSKFLTVLMLTVVDCGVLLGPLMLPYGLGVQLLAYLNLFWKGNRVEYIPAAKALSAAAVPKYGSVETGTPAGGDPISFEKVPIQVA